MDSSRHLSTDARPRTAVRLHSPSASVQLGKWELTACLGEGEWSTVYAGRPLGGRAAGAADYAIKVLKVERGQRAQAEQLLTREALIGTTVVHPHLTTVLSAQRDSTTPHIVMPLLPGVSLEKVVPLYAPFTTPHALWIVRQVATALAALHEAGWMHADVKPANIHVSPTGHATLLDLGFALQLDSSECAPRGALHGSLAYTAPEMISASQPVDGRADVYSLGITLYELLTGELPFATTQPGPLMLAHLQSPVPKIRKRFPNLHRDLWRLLLSMLAKQPLRRPTAAELVDRMVPLEIATFEERVA